MKKQLHFDCSSGVSGDMLVASLLDVGASREKLKEVLTTVPAKGFEIRITKVNKAGVEACDFDVVLDEDNHDHDMEYLYGHLTGEEIPGEKDAFIKPSHHKKHTPHRNLADVISIIENTLMSDNAKQIATEIFGIVAKAESVVHNEPIEEVHFHEVGAIDSIVDIIAVAVCIDDIAPDKITFDGLIEGCGTVRCQHGILDVPVPAVKQIASDYGLVFEPTSIQGELITPTGAAALAYLASFEKAPEKKCEKAVGYGAGKRVYDCPGYVRASIIWVD